MPSCTAFLSSTSTASHLRLVGKNSRPTPLPIIFRDLRSPDDLQLHPDQPIPDLPAAVSPPLPRRLAGEGYPCGDVLWAGVRTGLGCLLPPRTPGSGPVSRMGGVPEARLAVLER